MIARKLKDATIKNKTKKSSEEWYSILDAYKEGNKNHTLMAKSPEEKDRIIHAALKNDALSFMASDGHPNEQIKMGDNIHMSIVGSD